MKRILALLLCILVLSGCSAIAPDSYHSVTPHEIVDPQISSTDAAEAADYHSLKVAILNQVRTGRTESIIHVASDYEGDVEEDLKQAAYEVSTMNPLGAYAVEYMTHSCNLLVSYYEIRVSITFRRTAQEIASLKTVSSEKQLQELLVEAVDTFDDRLAVHVSDYNNEDEDIAAFVAEYAFANPATVIEVPKIAVSVYPETGKSRIIEASFHYKNNPQGLQAKRRAVETNIDAAAEYIRYRQEDYDKIHLLYSYLTQRFQYRQAETATPLYDALCSGIADPTGLSQAWTLICEKAGVECMTVTGMKNGEPYTWNILRTGSHYRHLDLAQCILERSGLVMHSDGEMTAYYWNMEQYPSCEPLPAAQPETEAPPEEEETETQTPEDEQPSEEEHPSEEAPALEETEEEQMS